jgi:hypothetical protein
MDFLRTWRDHLAVMVFGTSWPGAPKKVPTRRAAYASQFLGFYTGQEEEEKEEEEEEEEAGQPCAGCTLTPFPLFAIRRFICD